MSTERPLFDPWPCEISIVQVIAPEPPSIVSRGGSTIPVGEKRLVTSVMQSREYIVEGDAGTALYMEVCRAMADPGASAFFIVEMGADERQPAFMSDALMDRLFGDGSADIASFIIKADRYSGLPIEDFRRRPKVRAISPQKLAKRKKQKAKRNARKSERQSKP